MDRRWRRWLKGAGIGYARQQSVHESFSGLMDIRNLIASDDDDPLRADEDSITFSGTRGTAAAVPPVLLAQHQKSVGGAWKIGLGAVVTAAIALIAAAAALMLRTNDQPRYSGAIEANALAGTVDSSTSNAQDVETFAAAIPEPTPAPTPPEITAATAVSPRDEAKSEEPVPRKAKAGKKKEPAPSPAKQPKASSELDDLLGGAAKSSKKQRRERKRGRADDADTGDRPKTLTRAQVQAGMRAVAGKVRRCDKGKGGLVVVDVAIGKNGKVRRASVTGSTAGTKTGKCVARAVRKARFPKFGGPTITVKYPFRL
jgi:type IV secretory pathway VirB10-like protein